jgi:hypothetical protein
MLSNARTPYCLPKLMARSREVLHTATKSEFSRFESARAWKCPTFPQPTMAVLSFFMAIQCYVFSLKASEALPPPVRRQRTMSIADCVTPGVKVHPSA